MEALERFPYCVLLIEIVCLTFVVGSSFDPFMDSNLFSIKWLGPLELNQEEISDLGDRHLVMTTDKRETYHCILPESDMKQSDSTTSYSGPDVDEIMSPLFKQQQCSYRIESYWTYELCHGKSMKQFHETREQGAKPKVQEYFLGLGNSRTLPKKETDPFIVTSEKGESNKNDDSGSDPSPPSSYDESGSGRVIELTPIPTREFDGVQMPYYEVVMDDGTNCDLTGRPRKSRVMYICQPEGRGEIYEFKESSTCEYDVVVLVSLLCKHPSYRPSTQPVSEIRCHAKLGSPLKPSELFSVEREVKHLQTAPRRYPVVEDTMDATANLDEAKGEAQTARKSSFFQASEADKEAAKPMVKEDPQAALSSLTDRQTLRNILSGSQCLRGGTGWWKHEVCIGKFVKQFHKDKNVEAQIYLGYWNKEKHLQWMRDNPNRRPRPVGERRQVSLFYSDGDVCDLTGKPRSCEVRLKCLQNIKNKHAVILSLAEPSSCQYILTVESTLFCDAVNHADKNGLFENVEL